MKRSWLLVVAVSVLGFAACKQEEPQTQPMEEAPMVEEPAPAPEPMPAPTPMDTTMQQMPTDTGRQQM
jgi:hypothetical protein